MRIYRGEDYSRTDTVQPGNYIEEWKNGNRITLDGTKDKSGTKRTRLEIEIDDADVLALFQALLERYQQAVGQVKKLESIRFSGRKPEDCIREIKTILSEAKNA